jgi:nucleotide-binding universal stress UspA family protein
MRSTIVVPLDGSTFAERALPYAAAMARTKGSRLILVRAVLARAFPGADPTAAQIAVTSQAEDELQSIVERLQADGLTAEPHVYYDEAARAILDAAEAQRAEAIVMSTHGRSAPGRWVYGSVADRVLRRASVPVLLVPATCARPWPAEGPLHVLVPLDGSDFAAEALTQAGQLAAGREVVLHLLYVVEPPPPMLTAGAYVADFDPQVEQARALHYLGVAAHRLQAAGRCAVLDAVVGDPATEISAAARAHGAHLIALATHGRGGLSRFLLGSVASAVLQRASVPLLLVRPGAVQQAAATSSAPAEPASRSIAVTLSPRELAIVEQGLEALLRDAEQEAGARVRGAAGAQAVCDLLAQLKQAEPVAPR